MKRFINIFVVLLFWPVVILGILSGFTQIAYVAGLLMARDLAEKLS